MKKVKIISLSVVLLIVGTLMISATKAGDFKNDSFVKVPSSMQEKVIEFALENNCISKDDAQILRETNAIDQCADAFISSGYDPSAPIDKLAEIGVSSGKFSSKSQAKTVMKATAEKMRKKESIWEKFYDLIGL